jgi:hypothetical protein
MGLRHQHLLHRLQGPASARADTLGMGSMACSA